MTAAKSPPERVMVHWIMGLAYCTATPYDTADEPHVYVLASVVEKRERALREAAMQLIVECLTRDISDAESRAICDLQAALAASDEGEAKPNEWIIRGDRGR